MSYTFRSDRVCLAILLKRKPAEVHGPLVVSLAIVRENLVKYEQAHSNEGMLQQFQEAGFRKSEWDGMAIMEAETYAKLMEVIQSQGFQSVLTSDAEKFIDVSEIQFIPLDLITSINKA
ncbi:hypothetical protein B0H13DRAFT_2686113 [Mycena leptocephala]|nr:hypothetical protein B0H13DRAFT_2686113 [Mycena leptocephala]